MKVLFFCLLALILCIALQQTAAYQRDENDAEEEVPDELEQFDNKDELNPDDIHDEMVKGEADAKPWFGRRRRRWFRRVFRRVARRVRRVVRRVRRVISGCYLRCRSYRWCVRTRSPWWCRHLKRGCSCSYGDEENQSGEEMADE